MKKCLAIIPARKGSKRIRNKNLIDFFGKPLLQYTIDAAVKSNIFTDIVISTDYSSFQSALFLNNKVEILYRKQNLSNDEATVMDVANDVLDRKGDDYDYVFILLPTTPLRSEDDITNAYQLLISNSNINGVVSVSEYNYPLIYAIYGTESGIKRAFPEDALKKSQQQDEVFADNGGIYALSVGSVREKDYFPSVTIPYKMKRWSSVDIDSLEDLEIAKAFYSYFIDKKK